MRFLLRVFLCTIGMIGAIQARASIEDCSQLNGRTVDVAAVSGFIIYHYAYRAEAGDRLSFNIIGVISGAGQTVEVFAGPASIGTFTAAVGTVGPFTVPAAGDTFIGFRDFSATGTQFRLTLSCANGVPPSASNTDSAKLAALQAAATKAAAQASASAFGNILQGAIGGSFTGGSGSATPGSTSGGDPFTGQMSLGFRDRKQSAPSSRSPIHVWGDARVSGADDDDNSIDYNFSHAYGAAGADYRLHKDVVVGVLGGYEDFRYKLGGGAGKLDGDGFSAGAYLGWRFLPNLRLDAGVAKTWLDYDAEAETAAGKFDGDRWVYLAGITGTQKLGRFDIEPSSHVVWLNEDQENYTDSLGTRHADRNFTEGRVATGAKVSTPLLCAPDLIVAPYAGAYADYYFSDDDAVLRTVPNFGISDGWSARVTSGAVISGKSDAWSVNLGGELGNIGSGDGLIPTGRAGASFKY